MEGSGKPEAEIDRQSGRVKGITLIGSRHQSLYAGFVTTGAGSIIHQCAGERVVAMIDVEDALTWYRKVTKAEEPLNIKDWKFKKYALLRLRLRLD